MNHVGTPVLEWFVRSSAVGGCNEELCVCDRDLPCEQRCIFRTTEALGLCPAHTNIAQHQPPSSEREQRVREAHEECPSLQRICVALSRGQPVGVRHTFGCCENWITTVVGAEFVRGVKHLNGSLRGLDKIPNIFWLGPAFSSPVLFDLDSCVCIELGIT